MEVIESIGFIHYWGLSPSVNLIDHDYNEEIINVLITGSSDCRHILKTLSDNANNEKVKEIHFYVHEK